MDRRYSVLIIGAGKIGACYDSLDSPDILTHAHAFCAHKAFRLAGFVDTDPAALKKAVSHWGGSGFTSLKEAFNREGRIDVACVATPDETHYEMLSKLCNFPVKLIFVEKPPVETLAQADDIMRKAKKKKISIAVNYSRRFAQEYEDIRKNIKSNKYGRFLTGNGFYGKGLVHNGSHMVDLLRYFLGEIKAVDKRSRVNDFKNSDPTISAVLSFGGKRDFFLQGVDCRSYTIFELDLLFEKTRLRFVDSGSALEEYSINNVAADCGIRNLGRPRVTATSARKALYFAAENMYRHLSRGEALKCSFSEGVKTLAACKVIQNAGKG